MPSKAVVERWRAESWAWVEAGDPEAMREDERIVELADALTEALGWIVWWWTEEGEPPCDARELLETWLGKPPEPLPFEP